MSGWVSATVSAISDDCFCRSLSGFYGRAYVRGVGGFVETECKSVPGGCVPMAASHVVELISPRSSSESGLMKTTLLFPLAKV